MVTGTMQPGLGGAVGRMLPNSNRVISMYAIQGWALGVDIVPFEFSTAGGHGTTSEISLSQATTVDERAF
jgi:hypothetical protein